MLTEKSSHKDIELQAANTRLYMNRLCTAWQGRTWEEAHMNYTFDDYRKALDGAGPKLKELVLDRAANDPAIGFPELKALVDFAYPEVLYAKPQNAIDRHCRGALKRGIPHPQSPGKTIEMLFIPEGDIYRMAAKSELPSAERFESWIFDEVLPSIRKNGGYIHGQENMTPEELMAAALIMANKTIENQKLRLSSLTVENQIMAPKAAYFDELVDRNLLTGLRETAKELNVPPKQFVSFLLGGKYLYRDKKKKLMPYQQHVDAGLFELKECFNDKTQWGGTQTMVTPKGRETFRLLIAGAA